MWLVDRHAARTHNYATLTPTLTHNHIWMMKKEPSHRCQCQSVCLIVYAGGCIDMHIGWVGNQEGGQPRGVADSSTTSAIHPSIHPSIDLSLACLPCNPIHKKASVIR